MLKIKQQEIKSERERLKRLEKIRKEQISDKHKQISEDLNDSKEMITYLNKVKGEQNRQQLKFKDEMMEKLERSAIWNK